MARLWRWLAVAALVGGADPYLPDLERAAAMQSQGRIDEAEKVYAAVLEQSPDHPDALHLLGLVVYARLDAEWYETGVRPDPGHVAQSVDLVRRAVAKRPNDSNILTNFGELLRWAGDHAGALEMLGRATALAPDSVGAWRNVAAVHFEAENWCGVVDANGRALRAMGVDPMGGRGPRADDDENLATMEKVARMDLGEALRRCRTLEEGLEFFKVSVAAWPDDPRLNLGAGVNAQHLGLLDVAAGYYEVAARIAADGPVRRQALVNRAAVDHERGAMELAIAGYRRVLDDFPEDTQALNNLGAALVTIGEHEQAMAVLDKCLKIDGDQPQALTNLAMHHANEGAVDEARDLLHRARRLLRARAGGNDNRGTSDGAGLLAREVTMMRPMVEDAGQMYGRPGADDCGLLRPRADSQDAWVFRAPLEGVDLPVELGRGKCDNHAAATFADAGYAVANPSLAVRPYHVQNCAKRANATAAPPKLRSYTSTTEVKGRVAYVPLSDAWLF
jgi:tetratricopeptide (TPR) repeat protein